MITRSVQLTAAAAAESIGIGADEVLVSSTGPIGIPLPVDKITASLPDAVDHLTDDMESFFHAIRTTDSEVKLAERGRVVGVAKGAAMIAPNMATMLAFLATDVPLANAELLQVLRTAVNRTFNRISIDACESTNDSVYIFSTGRGDPVDPALFAAQVEDVCATLAEKIVRDAEGGTRLVTIDVFGARDESHAADLGKAVAASDLWRAAVHGADPNWGRVLSAMGSVDRELQLAELSVSIGSVPVFENGEPTGSMNDASAEMEGDVTVACAVGSGPGHATVLACDLSPDYVKLNAFGTT